MVALPSFMAWRIPHRTLAEMALGLRKRAEHGYEYFAINLQGIHILFLKDDRYTKLFQRAYIIQAIDCVAGKSGYGLGEHDVDLALFTLADHTQELRTLAGGCTGYAFVGEDTRHSPLFIGHDLIRVVIFLRLVAGELLFVIGGNSAISSNTELPL